MDESYRFAVLDPPPSLTPNQVVTERGWIDCTSAVPYYPWIIAAEPGSPTQSEIKLPPSGVICGIYARVDREW